MTKIITILAASVVFSLIAYFLAKAIGFDQWWADVICYSTSVTTTWNLMRDWAKTEGLTA